MHQTLNQLEDSLLKVVEENYNSLCNFEHEINLANDNHEDQVNDVRELKRLKENVEKSAKSNIALYKTALDDLANKTRLVDVFSLQNISPPTDGSTFFNQVFSWCTEILYESPTTSYEWYNFCQECFVQDYGVDFLARLRGVNVAKFSNYQYAITKQLTQYFKFLRREVQNSEFNKLLDCIDYIVAAYEARKSFLDDKAEYEAGLEKYRSADIALKVEGHLRENFCEFVSFSTSVHNTVRDTLDWYYWCKGEYVSKEDQADFFVNEPLDINDYVKDKKKTIKFSSTQQVSLKGINSFKKGYDILDMNNVFEEDLVVDDEEPINKLGWSATKNPSRYNGDHNKHECGENCIEIPAYYESSPAPESIVRLNTSADKKFRCTIF